MSNVLFAPWIGEKYDSEGFRGLRVLVLSESHYGPAHSERPTVTPETIKALAQAKKHQESQGKRLKLHPHYGKILASMHGASSADAFGKPFRRNFWERVCYYNYFQVMLRGSRRPPPQAAWATAGRALEHVLAVLSPDLVLVFSKRVGKYLLNCSLTVPMEWVNHPSSGFTYKECNPRIAAALDAAVSAKSAFPATTAQGARHADFDRWFNASRRAEPSHGGRLSPERRAQEYARWAMEMKQARVLLASLQE